MSDDILSGGRIDESTSGPTPPSRDDRSRDILSEQKERQDQDAIGGTQFPPRPQPLPPIPKAPEVAPPLPVVPSFDFNISGSALEEFREISRQTTMDILKNVNINGQGPSIEGSAISFNIPQQPPASEAFIFQGIMVSQPLPQIQPLQAPAFSQPPQIEPAQEIQSIVVAPPSRRSDQQEVAPEVPQNNQLTTTIETIRGGTTENVLEQPLIEVPIIEQPTQIVEDQFIPPTVTPPQQSASEAFSFQNGEIDQEGSPTVNILPPQLQPREDAQSVVISAPSRPREEPESISEQREREGNERESRDQEIRVSLGLAPVSVLDQPSETVTPKGKPISEQNDEENAARAQRDKDVRASAGLEGEDPMDEESDSAQAYKKAEARSDERRGSDPNFDPESDIRQQGETMSEYKERQEKLEQKKAEEADAIEGEAGLTRESSGPIAVQLNRADGQGKVFAFLRSDFSTLDEPTLPTSEYYVGGDSGGGPHPWRIELRTIPQTNPPQYQYAIESASRLFDGFGGTQISVSGADGVFRNLVQGFYFIEVDFGSNLVINQAQIMTGGSIGQLVVTSGDPPQQTKLRQQIGYVYFDNGTPIVRQTAWHNYSLFQTCRDSTPIKVTVAT